MAKIMGQEVDS